MVTGKFSLIRFYHLTLFCLLCTVMQPICDATAETDIQTWSYYLYPPFITEEGKGLSYEFIDIMNDSAQGLYKFKLNVMPRKRIDLHISQGESGIVLFVNPAWMQPPEGITHNWSKPLFSDRNGIISNKSNPVEYNGPASVHGLLMGGVLGRKYNGLDQEVEKGAIFRQDSLNEALNVRKLAERRIDFMTAPESVLRFLVRDQGVEERIHFSKIPLFEYERYILSIELPYDYQQFLKRFVDELPYNPKWKALKEKYQIP